MNFNTKTRTIKWLYCTALLGCTGLGLAQGAGHANIVPELSAFKVVTSNGADKLVSAEKVAPGETIEYQVVYANKGDGAAKNLQAVLPIPSSLEFVAGSAQPANVKASLNGKTYAALPLKRTIKVADGTDKVVTIPVSEYRFLKWSIASVDAGKAVRVAARAQLPNVGKAN